MYYQPMITGNEFNFKEAAEIEKTILEMSVMKVYPLGFRLVSIAL